jgi:hypothetical protein
VLVEMGLDDEEDGDEHEDQEQHEDREQHQEGADVLGDGS